MEVSKEVHAREPSLNLTKRFHSSYCLFAAWPFDLSINSPLCSTKVSWLTCVCVNPKLAANSARSGSAKYCVRWNRRLSCWSWSELYIVRGLRIFLPLPFTRKPVSSILSANNEKKILSFKIQIATDWGKCSQWNDSNIDHNRVWKINFVGRNQSATAHHWH